MTIDLPSHAYVPGKTPRHPENTFDDLRATAIPGQTEDQLAESAAFRAGLLFRANGFYWEAHEVLEPVWLACATGSEARTFVQAVIQTANAQLKLVMGRPKAARRLCDIALDHMSDLRSGPILGCDPNDLREEVGGLRQRCAL